ncbi:MAG: YlxR family protein [Deltaproteobacteria bacterium]|nr:YlxR family protein [Deltaproteobacteria bacterium]
MSKAPRTCLGCRAVKDKGALVRFTVCNEKILPDFKGCAPGRGVYICRDEGCVREALNKKGAFSKALRTKVAVPLADEVWAAVRAGLKL